MVLPCFKSLLERKGCNLKQYLPLVKPLKKGKWSVIFLMGIDNKITNWLDSVTS